MSTRRVAEHRRELKRIIRKIEAYFNKTSYYPRGHMYLDKVVFAHVSKALRVARSVVSLIEAGFPEEAFGLSRTLVEIALNLRFITNRHSERRAQRFVHYLAKWKMELLRRMLKHFYRLDKKGNKKPIYRKAALRSAMPDYKRLVKMARKYPNRTSWTETSNRKASRGGAWMMALEPDQHELMHGLPVKWEFDYDWIYFWTSQYVHATAVSMDDNHAVLPRDVFLMRRTPERGQYTAGLAVLNTAVYVAKILVLSFRALQHPLPSSLRDPLWKLLKGMNKSDKDDVEGRAVPTLHIGL